MSGRTLEFSVWSSHARPSGTECKSPIAQATPSTLPLRCSAIIPAGAVLHTMEPKHEPSFEARGIMRTMEHRSYKEYKMPSWPLRTNRKPPTVKASPILGEHTAEVLSGWLGLRANDVEKLTANKIV